MPNRVCSQPGCPLIIPSGQRYRDDCVRCIKRKSESGWRARKSLPFYHTARWQKIVAYILSRDPVCKVCDDALSVEVDHKVSATEENEELWFDEDNLQGICNACHRAKTSRSRRGRGDRIPNDS